MSSSSVLSIGHPSRGVRSRVALWQHFLLARVALWLRVGIVECSVPSLRSPTFLRGATVLAFDLSSRDVLARVALWLPVGIVESSSVSSRFVFVPDLSVSSLFQTCPFRPCPGLVRFVLVAALFRVVVLWMSLVLVFPDALPS